MSYFCEAVKGNNERCKFVSTWSYKDKSYCATHARGKKANKLAKDQMANLRQVYIEHLRRRYVSAAKSNLKNGRPGHVIVTKLRMRKVPEYAEGYLAVFPNFKHENRLDGFGAMYLSPMYLGPVEHGQPGLPIAKNIENFHQANKVYEWELGKKGGLPKSFFRLQRKMYKDSIPKRHKYDRGDKPIYSVWRDRDSTLYQISYVESRQFYCTFYERLVNSDKRAKKKIAALRDKLEQGINLQIFGYDGRSICPQTVMARYLDPNAPFGHELVLYCILVLEPANYPWRAHTTFEF